MLEKRHGSGLKKLRPRRQRQGRMEAIQVHHMNGGNDEESYATNSSVQRKAITIAKPIVEEAIKDVYCKLFPNTIWIADMGCSNGPNTFYAISHIMEAVDSISRNLGRESPEFLIHLNDLPSIDFNTIFRYIPRFQEDLGPNVGPCFITGVPGSFYERRFPSQSLHFVHSSYSLHWLSQVPKEAEDNKRNIYISPTSPPNVVKAYLKQFDKDFSTFLRCRAMELVDDGCMVLTFLGRSLEDPTAWKSQGVFGPLSKTINDMVNEGLIEAEKLDSFNMPFYFASILEVKTMVEEEGSFFISRIGLDDVHWNMDDPELSTPDMLKIAGLDVAKNLRAVWGRLLASHFGDDIMDDVFSRFAGILSDCMSKEKTMYHNVTISLKKRD